MATLTGQDAQSVGQEVASDELLRENMASLLREAAERVTFHEIEIERWRRLGRAAAAALREAESCSPVAKTSTEDFFPDGKVASSPPDGPRY